MDVTGEAWETIFDVISLGTSIMEVVTNPRNAWNWIGLAGDALDLIPFVTGLGETTRLLKTVDKINGVSNTAKSVTSSVSSTKKVAEIITGYTSHGVSQAISRNGVVVKPSAILDTVRNPIKVAENVDSLARISIKYTGNQSVVVLNSAGKIVTCWAKNVAYWRVKILNGK